MNLHGRDFLKLLDYTPEEIESLKKWLDSRETYYIKQFNSNNKKFGYNLTEGGTCLPKTINNYTPKFNHPFILKKKFIFLVFIVMFLNDLLLFFQQIYLQLH